MVSFVCGLQYTRVIKLLRVFVELIAETMNSVKAFTIVLFYILIAVTCTFYFGHKREGEISELTLFQEFRKQYRIMLYADFIDEVDDYELNDWIYFAVFTFFITVVLMNLLIAIIGDTFVKVMASE